MGLLPWVWYGGRAGVAVLYSVVVGAVREFWVRTAAADVKVHEIPLEIDGAGIPWEPFELPDGNFTYVPNPSPPSISWEWRWRGLEFPNRSFDYTVWTKPSFSGFDLSGCNVLDTGSDSFAGSGDTNFGGGSYFPAAGFYNRPGPIQSFTDEFGVNPSFCGGRPSRNNAVRFSSINEQTGVVTYFQDGSGSTGGGSANPGIVIGGNSQFSASTWPEYTSGYPTATNIEFTSITNEYNFYFESWFVDVSDGTRYDPPVWGDGDLVPPPPSEPPKILNPYESFASALKPKVFALIKSNLNDSDEEFGELAYKQLIGETVSDLGSTASGDDWRGAAVSLIPTASITNADSCIETYLDTEDGALIDGTLYRINLDQTISGNTLRNRLQTSPDTVTATLTTQSATSGVSCTLGTATESPVEVPSPGRGTIEGITYLP